MKDYLEILICKWLIARLKWGYGECDGSEPKCPACAAHRAIQFLEGHIELLKQ